MTTPCVDLLFIQGAGAGAHDADQVLADALGQALGPDFRRHFPRMPDEGAPDNDVWKQAISTALRRTRATFLVAHSAGGAVVADLLAQGGGSGRAGLIASDALLGPASARCQVLNVARSTVDRRRAAGRATFKT